MRPHLVLAHVGGHDGVPGDSSWMVVQDLVGVRMSSLLQRGGSAWEKTDSFQLGGGTGQALVEQLQHPLGVADDVVVGEHVLVDLRPVDVDVDDLGLAGEGGGVGGHPVGEPAAHGDEQVALVAGHVGGLGAVHADHAGGEGVGPGEAAAAHDGDGHRGVQLLGNFRNSLVRPAADHAAAADEQGPLGLGDHLHQVVHVARSGSGAFRPWLPAQLAARRPWSRFSVQGMNS